MTTEQKLQKCIEFIRKIENGDLPFDEYSSDDTRDKAWHLLADVDGL